VAADRLRHRGLDHTEVGRLAIELGVTLTATATNPTVGDLELTDTGDEVVRTDLGEEVAQRLRVRLLFFQGEWFLNLEEGLPYYQSIFVKGLKDKVVRSVFGQAILGTQGVAQLLSLTHEISTSRRLSLIFKVKLEDGTTFSSTDYGPFIVSS